MPDRYDMSIMLVTHHALRRDLERLTAAAGKLSKDPGRAQGVLLGWRTLRGMLHEHHQGEDKSLWPRMRTGLAGRDDDLAVLDAMESEHARVDPLLFAVDQALEQRHSHPEQLESAIGAFTTEVSHHLTHEEKDALPLIPAAMSPAEWSKALAEMRGSIADALRAAPEFFPWLLDDATPEDRTAILGLVPPPVRVLYQRVWQPRYAKQGRWS
jgi:iron-sulfur cluster repair protein YtfE (RIC family)